MFYPKKTHVVVHAWFLSSDSNFYSQRHFYNNRAFSELQSVSHYVNMQCPGRNDIVLIKLL